MFGSVVFFYFSHSLLSLSVSLFVLLSTHFKNRVTPLVLHLWSIMQNGRTQSPKAFSNLSVCACTHKCVHLTEGKLFFCQYLKYFYLLLSLWRCFAIAKVLFNIISSPVVLCSVCAWCEGGSSCRNKVKLSLYVLLDRRVKGHAAPGDQTLGQLQAAEVNISVNCPVQLGLYMCPALIRKQGSQIAEAKELFSSNIITIIFYWD